MDKVKLFSDIWSLMVTEVWFDVVAIGSGLNNSERLAIEGEIFGGIV